MHDSPAIFVYDPGATGSLLLSELEARYAGVYDVIVATTERDARHTLVERSGAHETVALILADRAVGGARFLESVRDLHPQARRGLLLNWNEIRTHREEIAAAFRRRHAECLVTKPIGVPDERFHRTVTELLDEWWRVHRSPIVSVWMVDAADSPRGGELADFLQRHDVAFTLHTAGTSAAADALAGSSVGDGRLPVVGLADGRVLVDPSNLELAAAVGARTRPGEGIYDLLVVGGGPAGLSAAVYAQSEGLRTGLVEPTAMGGQAGTSSMIRNYLGFPRGISGSELAARAFEQAILFGTEMIYGNAATDLRTQGDLRVVTLADGTEVPCRSVIIATGVSYRRLTVPSLEQFQGRGVFYGAATAEAPGVAGQPVFVVGGGNSAGQAAVHLAKFARRVTILVRGESLANSMSDYLVAEIDATPNIDVQFQCEVAGGAGTSRLESIDVLDRSDGSTSTRPASGLFVLIGAAPFTDWLPVEVERDAWGYLETGPTTADPGRSAYETAVPGVFAVGDVRRDSVKRVASAVGEGAVCVRLVHDHLAALDGATGKA